MACQRRGWWDLAGLWLGALLVTAACRPAERTLVVAFDDLPATLDPHLQNHHITWSVLANFYDPLVAFSPDMRLQPALASSWRQLDATHWRFELRPGVRFHDGSPLTSADVAASFERVSSHPRSVIRHYLVGVQRVSADGDGAVLVETAGPAPDLLNRMPFVFIVPRTTTGEEITSPVGTGAFRFVGRGEDGSVEARAFDGWRGQPAVGRVRMTFFSSDDRGPLRRLLAGEVDVLRQLADNQRAEIEGHPHVSAVLQPRLGVQLLAVIPAAAEGDAGRALADPRVRRAMLLALDRPRWVGEVFRGSAVVASQLVHPVVFGYDPAVRELPHDPVTARRLLAEAGFAGGFSVPLWHGFATPQIVAAIQHDLAAVGIRVELRAAPFAELLGRARLGEIPLLYYTWSCTTGDASDILNSSVHTPDPDRGLGAENFARFSDPVVDGLLEAADVELDPGRRLALLQQAQRRVLEALPIIPLSVRWGHLGVSDRIEVVPRHDERLWLAAYRWRS